MMAKISFKYRLGLLISVVIASLVLVTCGQPAQTIDFTLVAQTADVYSGPGPSGSTGPLPTVEQGSSVGFPSGNLVTTDHTDGQALLQGTINGSSSCEVYVFYDSAIRKCACSRDSCGNANESCTESGSTVFQDCSNHLASTANGEFQHTGTRLGVIYDQQRQLSVFILMEGSGTFTPVDPVTHARGTPVRVTAVNPAAANKPLPKLIFTFTGDGTRVVAGLNERTPLDLNELPLFLQSYPDLVPWVRPVRNFSLAIGVGFPDLRGLLSAPYVAISVHPLQWNPNYSGFLSARSNVIPVALQFSVANLGEVPVDTLRISLSRYEGTSLIPVDFFLNGDPKANSTIFNQALPGSRTVHFSGVASFPPELLGKEVSLVAMVDSCAGRISLANLCRPTEINQKTNQSSVISIKVEPPPR